MASTDFPPGFLFGAASAGHHVEGGLVDDWTEWLPANAERLAREAHTKDLGQGTAARLPASASRAESYLPTDRINHYARYREDLLMARQLHLNAYRFSVEWSRVQPHEHGGYDRRAIEHYCSVAGYAYNQFLEPVAVFSHFTLPPWASRAGGWCNPAVVAAFARFAAAMAEEMKATKLFATLNEPETYAMMTSAPKWFLPSSNAWLDYPQGVLAYQRMRQGLLEAHLQASAAIKRARPDAEVGITLNHTYYDGGADPLSAFLRRVGKHFTNDYLIRRVADSCDWIGLQYYFHCRINGFKVFDNDFERRSDMGWELYPAGLAQLLLDANKYGKPIYVTECGLADANDQYRRDYIEECLKYVLYAIRDGVDCRGFFYFSLTDGPEWDKGDWVKTGLITVDGFGKRHFRYSAERYAEIAEQRSL